MEFLKNIMKNEFLYIIAITVIVILVLYLVSKYLEMPGETVEENLDNVEMEHVPSQNVENKVKPTEPEILKQIALLPEDMTNGSNGQELTPEDLLPSNSMANTFEEQHPNGEGEVGSRNFLQAGHHIGINTVGSSLKNPNLQLRSDPIIPREDVGPWNQSTILPSDIINRKPLEL